MKVFKMNEFDWWAGECLDEVCKAYVEEFDDCLEPDEVRELTPVELASHTFYDDEDRETSPKRTFAEQLQLMIDRGEKFPCIFATKEY